MECLIILFVLAALPIAAAVIAKLFVIGLGCMLAFFGLTMCAAIVSALLGMPA